MRKIVAAQAAMRSIRLFLPPSRRIKVFLTIVPQVIPFLLFILTGFIPARLARNQGNPWVISGHKGRIYEDNCRALHEYITSNTDQEIIWISSSNELTEKLREKGHRVLKKHSFAARYAIISAPVLIYSHGEDDLDNFMILWRKCLGSRFLLCHGVNYIKGALHRKPGLLTTDFDWLLACSETERKNRGRRFPKKTSKIILGGGAHLDRFIRARDRGPEKLILYFPTHRETTETKDALHRVIEQIGTSKELRSWLRDSGYRFAIGRHINSNYSFSFESDNNVFFIEPEEVLEHLFRSELFISDYSGLLVSHLLLERSAIYFPFDLDRYQGSRNLFIDYSSFRVSPTIHSTEALINLIIEVRWKSYDSNYISNRSRLMKKFFITTDPVYAQASYSAIVSKLNE